MSNVPQTTTAYLEKLRQALQRDTTLRQLAAQATTRYAGEKARDRQRLDHRAQPWRDVHA